VLRRSGERVARADLDVVQEARGGPPRVHRHRDVGDADEMELASRSEQALSLAQRLGALWSLFDSTDDPLEECAGSVHGAMVAVIAPGGIRAGADVRRGKAAARSVPPPMWPAPPPSKLSAKEGGDEMEVSPTDPFRAEHRALLEHVAELRRAAAEMPRLVPAEREVLLHRLVGFLREELLPHAQAEEHVLYPEVARLLGAPEATAPMLYDHRAIRERVVQLEDCDMRDPDQLQELLFGLYALIAVHFEKEEDLYLSLLDSRGSERVGRVIEATNALDPV
jgi:iron-sulfur cluster repair protein YtfE (RIC family)